MNPLDRLEPLIAPPPVVWWPPAPGWWLLAALLLGLCAALWHWRAALLEHWRRLHAAPPAETGLEPPRQAAREELARLPLDPRVGRLIVEGREGWAL